MVAPVRRVSRYAVLMDLQETFRHLRERASEARQAAPGRIDLPCPAGWQAEDLEAFALQVWRVLSGDAPLGEWISEPHGPDLVDRGRLGEEGGVLVHQTLDTGPEALRTEVWAVFRGIGVLTAFGDSADTALVIEVHASPSTLEPVESLVLGLLPAL